MAAEILIMSAFLLIPILGAIGAGGLMVYSAMIGEGVERPEPTAWWQLRANYHARGPVGFVFLLAGLFGLGAMIRFWWTTAF